MTRPWTLRSPWKRLGSLEMLDFSRLLKRRTEAGFDFVIVGGYAALTHGSTLITRDLDICALLTKENVEKLRRTLADLHPKHRMTPQRRSFLDHPAPGVPVENLDLQTDVGVIDILSSILGVGDFERLKRSAEILDVDGTRYQVISLDDLIRAKEAIGRKKGFTGGKGIAGDRGEAENVTQTQSAPSANPTSAFAHHLLRRSLDLRWRRKISGCGEGWRPGCRSRLACCRRRNLPASYS